MENTVETVTTTNIFQQAGETLSGFMELCVNFFNGLWANPMGKIIITIGLVGAAIGLCYRLFLRRKHI